MNMIPNEIISYWIDKYNSLTSTTWRKIWYTKSMQITLSDGHIHEQISNFQNITALILDDDSIVNIPITLKKLVIRSTYIIKQQLIRFANITTLHLTTYSKIINSDLASFTNLTELRLSGVTKITSECAQYLTKLVTLKLCDNYTMYNIDFLRFTSLTTLKFYVHNHIGTHLRYLTNLTSLRLYDGNRITHDDLRKLTNLTKLNMICRGSINYDMLRDYLPQLSCIYKGKLH